MPVGLLKWLPEAQSASWATSTPVDLMIFAWLRARLAATKVQFLGIGDELLRDLQFDAWENSIACAPSEISARGVLEEVFPDFRQTVGPRSADLLDSGAKLELEAILSAKRAQFGSFLAAL